MIRKSYDVFVSYAHPDAETAERVVRALVRVGLTVFDASSESTVLWGADLYSSISELFPERTHAAIILLSKVTAHRAGAGGSWTS